MWGNYRCRATWPTCWNLSGGAPDRLTCLRRSDRWSSKASGRPPSGSFDAASVADCAVWMHANPGPAVAVISAQALPHRPHRGETAFCPMLRFACGGGYVARRLTDHLHRTIERTRYAVGISSVARRPGEREQGCARARSASAGYDECLHVARVRRVCGDLTGLALTAACGSASPARSPRDIPGDQMILAPVAMRISGIVPQDRAVSFLLHVSAQIT